MSRIASTTIALAAASAAAALLPMPRGNAADPAAPAAPPAVTARVSATPLATAVPAANLAAGLAPVPAHRLLHVAVFKGGGTSDSRDVVIAALRKDAGLTVDDITTEDIVGGKLAAYDVLVQPGGSGSGQARALGEAGRETIKRFVKGGGGYLGICGGSYLASDDYPWSLGILNAKVLDQAHWARGHGPVAVVPTTEGKKLLGANTDSMTIIYWQGPIMAPKNDPNLPPYAEWATFNGEVHRAGVPGGVMPGTTAVAAAPYGKGRVVCFSPHPEKTDGQETLLHHALLWMTEGTKP